MRSQSVSHDWAHAHTNMGETPGGTSGKEPAANAGDLRDVGLIDWKKLWKIWISEKILFGRKW